MTCSIQTLLEKIEYFNQIFIGKTYEKSIRKEYIMSSNLCTNKMHTYYLFIIFFKLNIDILLLVLNMTSILALKSLS